jgi:hypothetical protein
MEGMVKVLGRLHDASCTLCYIILNRVKVGYAVISLIFATKNFTHKPVNIYAIYVSTEFLANG